MAPYQYQSVASEAGSGIRLVNLLPGQFKDKIIVEILHADLSAIKSSARESQQAYEALSYVWGSKDNLATLTIRSASSLSMGRRLFAKLRMLSGNRKSHKSLISPEVEGGTLSITNNLNVALRHLRTPDKGRILWIDAICINQEDVEERNREVARMGQIYNLAARVLIWLGPESENSSLAIRTMRLFAKDLVHDWPPNSINRLSYREPGTKTELLLKSPILWDDENGHWLAIRKLFQRTWFTRLWVYQECQLASDALIVAGHDSITFPEFFRAGAWFSALSFQTPNILETLRFGAAMSIIFPWDNTLDFLMVMVKSCDCKDPRDRVYAIMALFPKALGPVYTPKPDYLLPVAEVYKDFFLGYIDARMRITFPGLPLFNFPPNDSSQLFPSWIPNLACSLTPFLLGFACGYSFFTNIRAAIDADDSLELHGRCIGKILKAEDPLPLEPTNAELLAYISQCEPLDLFNGTYPDGRTLLDAFTEALVCGARNKVCGNQYFTAQRLCDSFTDYRLNGKQFPTHPLTHATQYLRGRAFFSAEGAYFGIGPPTARPGDIICVLLGVQYPLILRPIPGNPGYFQLRGEAYIPGLMSGEGFMGPIPSGWEATWRDTWSVRFTDGLKDTQVDPRSPSLPPGWRMCFGDPEHLPNDEYDDGGKIRRMMFVNEQDGMVSVPDPRLTPNLLEARGIHMEKFMIR